MGGGGGGVFFFQAEDGIRDRLVTGVQTCALPIFQQGLFKASPVPSGRSYRVKVQKPLPSFLGQRDVARLLDAPDEASPLGLRDRAILEVLYSCGVRLGEIQTMDLPHVNFTSLEILVRGKGSKERWVLFGQPAAKA